MGTLSVWRRRRPANLGSHPGTPVFLPLPPEPPTVTLFQHLPHFPVPRGPLGGPTAPVHLPRLPASSAHLPRHPPVWNPPARSLKGRLILSRHGLPAGPCALGPFIQHPSAQHPSCSQKVEGPQGHVLTPICPSPPILWAPVCSHSHSLPSSLTSTSHLPTSPRPCGHISAPGAGREKVLSPERHPRPPHPEAATRVCGPSDPLQQALPWPLPWAGHPVCAAPTGEPSPRAPSLPHLSPTLSGTPFTPRPGSTGGGAEWCQHQSVWDLLSH